MFIPIRNIVLAYISLLIIFIITLYISSKIPSKFLRTHISQSVTILQSEGVYPTTGFPWRKIILDNYTDPLMLNTAYSIQSSEAFKTSLLGKRYYDNQSGQTQIDNLYTNVLHNPYPNVHYERYWHGYLIYLRPLLTIFNYETIRFINVLFLYGGLSWLLLLIAKKLGKKVALVILFGFFAVDFFFIWKSLQFSSVFYIAIYSSIYLLLHHQNNKQLFILFFIIGGLTSFFDLLTAPLITFGLPIILIILLNKKINLKSVMYYGMYWSFGYILLWASKWILVSWLFTPDAIQTSLNQVVNRTVTEADPHFSYVRTLQLNIFQLLGYDKRNKIIDLIIGILITGFVLKYISFSKQKLSKIILLLLVSILPYAWYLIAANHSYLHVWYTYRIQMITVISGLLIIIELVNWQKFRQDFPFLHRHSQRKRMV